MVHRWSEPLDAKGSKQVERSSRTSWLKLREISVMWLAEGDSKARIPLGRAEESPILVIL